MLCKLAVRKVFPAQRLCFRIFLEARRTGRAHAVSRPHIIHWRACRSASRHRAAPGVPSTAMSNSPRDWALPPGRASHVVESAKNPFDWAKGLMQPAPKPLAKGREHAFRPNIQLDWAIPLMRGDVRHQRYCPIAPVIRSEPAGGSRPASGERPRPQHTKRRRTREGGPPPTTRASAACDYPPRYAFRTSSSTSSSAPVPDFLIVPISST